MKPKLSGFTLIELMVVVAIVGIIAAIAYPSYMDSVRKSSRVEAKSELMDFAQRLQKCFTANGKFNDADKCSAYKTLISGTPYKTQGRGFYEIKISNATATAYLLTATAKSGTQLKDTECITITLDHKGATLPATCW